MAEERPEIRVNRASKGLAVIITNDYNYPGSLHSTLNGTVKDGERLEGAFKALKFDVCWKRNVNLTDIQLLWQEIKSFNFELVKHYKCMAFVFSGHGESEGKLVMQDGEKIDICDDFISPVLPGSARKIGDIPKIFFIDACRGNNLTQTVDVPKHTTGKGSPNSGGSAEVRKGCHDIYLRKLPKEGNFLAAYSTLPGCIAHDTVDTGSLWFEILARHLPVNRETIDNVLTQVNGELLELYETKYSYQFQHPETVTRWHRLLYLLDDVSERDDERTTPELMKLDPKTPEASARADQTPLRSNLTTRPGQSPLNRVRARPKGSGKYCARLKQYTKPQFDYIADHSSGSTRHRCTISYFKDGSKKYVDSGYYTSRACAEEQAAKKILSQENWLHDE